MKKIFDTLVGMTELPRRLGAKLITVAVMAIISNLAHSSLRILTGDVSNAVMAGLCKTRLTI